MILYVRNKKRWINFVKDVQSLRDLTEAYIPGTSICIGDLAMFSKQMVMVLLKFLEESPEISIYSSQDIMNPVLLSRFVQVIKDPVPPMHLSDEEFKESSKDFQQLLGTDYSNKTKIALYHASNSVLNIVSVL